MKTLLFCPLGELARRRLLGPVGLEFAPEQKPGEAEAAVGAPADDRPTGTGFRLGSAGWHLPADGGTK